MSVSRDRNMVSRPCTLCEVRRKDFGNIESAIRQDMEMTLRTIEKHENITGRINEI